MDGFQALDTTHPTLGSEPLYCPSGSALDGPNKQGSKRNDYGTLKLPIQLLTRLALPEVTVTIPIAAAPSTATTTTTTTIHSTKDAPCILFNIAFSPFDHRMIPAAS
jgi:hypothetical protein